MLEELFQLSQHFINKRNRSYVRSFFETLSPQNRINVILGQRGVGKTTGIIQTILMRYGDVQTTKALYIQADHTITSKYNLYDIAREFQNYGGELLCIDEVHKYPEWARELKSIYDTFDDLQMIVSGSSLLQIRKASHDLSRRVIVSYLNGLSFREYLNIHQGICIQPISLSHLLDNHQDIAQEFIQVIEATDHKILVLFKEYLKRGFYPYYEEFDEIGFYVTLDEQIHATLESDLPHVFPDLSGYSIAKMKKLLALIATTVPYIPDLKYLKEVLDIGDERTLKTYLRHLHDARIITMLPKKGKGMKSLYKPEKLYLNNSNLAYALGDKQNLNLGTIRECFFTQAIGNLAELSIPPKGDFLINDEILIEVGGRGKGSSQIKGSSDAYLVLDEMEVGINKKIPLWLFGFLY